MDGIPQSGEVTVALLDGINLLLKGSQVSNSAVEQCLSSLLVGEEQLDVVAMIIQGRQNGSNVVTISCKGIVNL